MKSAILLDLVGQTSPTEQFLVRIANLVHGCQFSGRVGMEKWQLLRLTTRQTGLGGEFLRRLVQHDDVILFGPAALLVEKTVRVVIRVVHAGQFVAASETL